MNTTVQQKSNLGPKTNSSKRRSIMKRIIGIAAAVVSIGILAGTASAGIVQHVLVSDAENARVLEFDLDGTYIGEFADFTGGRPAGIVQDSEYNIHIANAADGGKIRQFSTDGTEQTATFNGLTDVRPDDIAFNSSGQLFFGNPFGTAADGVYRVDTPSSATEVLHDADFHGDPRGITFDGNGNLLVADRRLLDGQGELESFDPDDSFSSNGALITDEPNIQAPLYHNGSVFYTFHLGPDSNDPAGAGSGFRVREIASSDGSILNTYDAPDLLDDGDMLFDTIVLSDGDLLVTAYAGDAVLRLDPDTGTFTDFASGNFGGVTMDGPSYMSVMTIIPEPTTLALLGLGVATLLGRRRRRRG